MDGWMDGWRVSFPYALVSMLTCTEMVSANINII